MPIFCQRTAAIGLLTVFMSTGVSAKPVIEIRQTQAKGGTSVGVTNIVVDGPTTARYDAVTKDTLDFWVTVSGNTPEHSARLISVTISAAGGSIQGDQPGAPRVYKLTIPYAPPPDPTVDNRPLSPIEICNRELTRRDGVTRANYLREGGIVMLPDAYPLRASALWVLERNKAALDPFYRRNFEHSARADAVVECRPLDRPRVRTQTTTTGAPSPITPKKMAPTISLATLRIEPAAKEVIGGQICPTELRLVGHVETIRAFNGKALFFGPGYLSPVTELDLADAGNRSFTGVRRLTWVGLPKRLTAAGIIAPKSQMISLKMNIAADDGKILQSVPETVRVTCEPLKSPGLASPGAE